MSDPVPSPPPAPDPDAAPPEDGVVVPAPPAPAPPPAVPWPEQVRRAVAGRLAARGIAGVGLTGLALAPAGIGALALATDHPGLGGVLGAAAFALAWLATATTERSRPPAFARLTAHALVPLWLGGIVVEAAAAQSTARAALAAWTSFILLLLPLARAQSVRPALTRGPLLWSWGERSALLVLGVALDRAGLAMFVTASVTTADLVLRLVLLHPRPDGSSRLPPGPDRLFGADGKPEPGVRLALRLAVVLFAVLLVALGTADGWRF